MLQTIFYLFILLVFIFLLCLIFIEKLPRRTYTIFFIIPVRYVNLLINGDETFENYKHIFKSKIVYAGVIELKLLIEVYNLSPRIILNYSTPENIKVIAGGAISDEMCSGISSMISMFIDAIVPEKKEKKVERQRKLKKKTQRKERLNKIKPVNEDTSPKDSGTKKKINLFPKSEEDNTDLEPNADIRETIDEICDDNIEKNLEELVENKKLKKEESVSGDMIYAIEEGEEGGEGNVSSFVSAMKNNRKNKINESEDSSLALILGENSEETTVLGNIKKIVMMTQFNDSGKKTAGDAFDVAASYLAETANNFMRDYENNKHILKGVRISEEIDEDCIEESDEEGYQSVIFDDSDVE